jgi:hypothetical protein
MSNNNVKFSTQSTNFWLNVALLVGGLFALSADVVTNVFAAGVSIIAFVGAIRTLVKKPDLKMWLTDANTWVYIANIVLVLLPSVPAEVFQSLYRFFVALFGQDYQGVILAVFSLANILLRWLGTKGLLFNKK